MHVRATDFFTIQMCVTYIDFNTCWAYANVTESHCTLSSTNCKAGETIGENGRVKKKEKKRRKGEKEDKGRVLGYRSRWIGTIRDDDMVYMPVNYPLSLVGEASHPCNVSLGPRGCDSVWSRYDGAYARLLRKKAFSQLC